MRLEKIHKLAATLRRFFEEHSSKIAAVYLFGSAARGRARPESDVDVGVLYAAPPASKLTGIHFKLEGDLERLLGKPVEIVDLNRAPADLCHRVLRDGTLVSEFDTGARIRFEVRARNEYFDILPYLRRYRKP